MTQPSCKTDSFGTGKFELRILVLILLRVSKRYESAEIKVIAETTSNALSQDELFKQGLVIIPELEEEVEANEVIPISAESDAKKNCKDDSYNYFEATSDCTGYIYCMMGVPTEPSPCPEGMLYSQSLNRCDWETSVKCEGAEDELFDEDGNPKPTKSPTARPTQPPNSSLDWDPNVIDRGYSKTIIGYVSRARLILR